MIINSLGCVRETLQLTHQQDSLAIRCVTALIHYSNQDHMGTHREHNHKDRGEKLEGV